ncbi:MAG: hypothetical protein U5R31_14730 [Acidimicrobiia bacterium]|nr:hypothetical protein [Acidimicrobiia bacterium]
MLATVGPYVQDWSAQPASRFSLTAALVEQRSIRIDEYREGTVPIDRVELGDELYSDKAPGQPFYAAPFYAVGRLAGLEEGTILRTEENLGVWWMTLWSSVIPMAALVILMYEAARRFYSRTAVAAALALWAGTLWLVLSATLYGHALATVLAFGGWMVLADRTPTASRAFFAGLLVGASVLTEYPMVIVVAALGGYLVAKRAYAKLPWYVLGGVPPALLLVWYQVTAFGDPLRNPYAAKADKGASHVSANPPEPDTFIRVVLGNRGLVFTAIVLVGAVATFWLIRRRLPGREHACGGRRGLRRISAPPERVAEPLGWRGSRTPLPHARGSVARRAGRGRVVAIPTTLPGRHRHRCRLHDARPGQRSSHSPRNDLLPWYVDMIRDEGFTPTIFTIAIGPFGWLFHLALLGATVFHLVRVRTAAALSAPTSPTAGTG